jgi:hypothetical protein
MNIVSRAALTAALLAFGSVGTPASGQTQGSPAGTGQNGAAGAPSGAPTQQAPPEGRRRPISVFSVLSRHSNAMGGSPAWDAIGPVELHMTTTISHPDSEDRTSEWTAILDGFERVRILQPNASGGTIERIRNGAYTWIEFGTGESRRVARQSKRTIQGNHFTALLNPWIAQIGLWFGTMEVGGIVDVDGVQCIRIHLQNRVDEFEFEASYDKPYAAFFSEETGRLVKIDFPTTGRMFDARSMHFSDWKEFGPVTIATRIRETIGESTRTIVINRMRFGEEVEPQFDVPDVVAGQRDPDAPRQRPDQGIELQRQAPQPKDDPTNESPGA